MKPLLFIAVLLIPAAETFAAEKANFERHIRPILKLHCFQCHGERGKREGGLDLRLRRLIVKGGESGAAIRPGSANQSRLWKRIVASEMPPTEVKKRLTVTERRLIRQWIEGGAITLRPEPKIAANESIIAAEERGFWSFRAIRRPAVPRVKNRRLVSGPVDAFLLARLESRGMSLSRPAAKHAQMRRLYLGLTGLPPTPEQAKQFLSDPSPVAYERLVDRLLASPQYGERWGRHWLDVAGYADSEGRNDADTIRKWAYRYRDYVIRSTNSDKPFDRFIREQLAGDEMIGRRKLDNLSSQEAEQLIATGFLRTAPDGTGSANNAVARNQVIADSVQVVSTALLGLTVGCAQCHDHRYDPIPQRDYYRFRAIFDPAFDWQKWRTPPRRLVSQYSSADRRRAAAIEKQAAVIDRQRSKKQQKYIQRTLEKELAKLPARIRTSARKARATPSSKRTVAQKQLLRNHPSVNVTAGSLYLYDSAAAADLKKIAARATKLRGTKPKQTYIRALTEVGRRPITHVFGRGDHRQRQEKVAPGELMVLTSAVMKRLPDRSKGLTSGRRTVYANWLTNGSHPLTARVIVNRVWAHHFGRGIVATLGDLGQLGARPSHPQLLDWLADEFMRGGWSLKRLHRLIVTSTAYRQSSRRVAKYQRQDADNILLWRANVRRLDAETLRDSVLSISGNLWLKPYGPAVPVMADRVGQFVLGIENLNAGRPGAVIDMKGEQYRRSVYVQVRRSRPLGLLDAFDWPSMNPNCTQRSSSTVAPQSLMLMNSQFATRESLSMAGSIAGRRKTDRDRVSELWLVVYARTPNNQELTEASQFLASQQIHFASTMKKKRGQRKLRLNRQEIESRARTQALAVLSQALISSNEFLYVE